MSCSSTPSLAGEDHTHPAGFAHNEAAVRLAAALEQVNIRFFLSQCFYFEMKYT